MSKKTNWPQQDYAKLQRLRPLITSYNISCYIHHAKSCVEHPQFHLHSINPTITNILRPRTPHTQEKSMTLERSERATVSYMQLSRQIYQSPIPNLQSIRFEYDNCNARTQSKCIPEKGNGRNQPAKDTYSMVSLNTIKG